jgi:hypothetical protein
MASEPADPPKQDEKSAPATKVLESALEGINKFGSMTSSPQVTESKSDSTNQPPALIWVRMSRHYLADFVEREVNREKPAEDVILGITFVGTSHTTGRTKLELRPNDTRAEADILFEGKIHSDTRGRKGPATLHYASNSTFRARKPIVIDDRGFRALPAVADAPTRLTPTSIQTNLPGLRGQIAHRIASRRAAESQVAADSEATQHRARDIREGLDQRINAKLDEFQARVQIEIAQLKIQDSAGKLVIKSRSTPDSVELALINRATSAGDFQMPKFETSGNPDLAVRVHRSISGNILANPELQARFAPFAASMLQSQLTNSEPNQEPAGVALEGDWVAFNISDAAHLQVPQVASGPQPQLR